MIIRGTVIAKGAPNLTLDGRSVICAILASEEIGLIRVYPFHAIQHRDVRVWSVIECEASKNSKDNRYESFRLNESADVHVITEIREPENKQILLDDCCLRSGTEDPLLYQNNRRASICVVCPASRLGGQLEPRDVNSNYHADADEIWVMPQCDFPYKPYVSWTSLQGITHTTHLCGQEVYEGMRHNASNPFRIWENLRVGDPDYRHWLVLGNMKDRRNVWVAAHLHRLKKTTSHTPLSYSTDGGRKEGWPYLQQEAGNAKPVNPQRTFEFIT